MCGPGGGDKAAGQELRKLRADVGDRPDLRGRGRGGQCELHLVCGGERLLDARDYVERGRHQRVGHPVLQPAELGPRPHRLGRQYVHRGVGAVVEQCRQ